MGKDAVFLGLLCLAYVHICRCQPLNPSVESDSLVSVTTPDGQVNGQAVTEDDPEEPPLTEQLCRTTVLKSVMSPKVSN